MSRFDRLAREWDLNPRRVESAKITTEKIKSLIDITDKTILDYGTGTGLIAFGLFEKAARIDAMDNAPGMLEALREKIESAGISNITPILHDIHHEPLPETEYDLIVTAMTLHHIDDPDMFVRKCVGALKRGGYLAISDLVSEDGTFHTMGNDDVKHFGFAKEEIEAIYARNGLKMIYHEIVQVIRKHRDFPIFLAVGQYG